ncbi:SRPBCC family protein [Promicromonospora sp. NPDC050880]|uniref:SRPBCC family protein n=1 Tax=Promicromonospora sp. NPDC050880 TaxID=3364406 RepID=UPI00379B7810
MTAVRFHITSALSPEDALRVLTDFGPARAEAWPTIDADHLTVHAQGDTWAEVTEGTAAAWEHARYEWDAERGRVDITTLDSKVFGPGGGWVFQVTPDDGGSRIDVELTRRPQTFQRKLLAALLPLVGPASLSKSFAGPLQAR